MKLYPLLSLKNLGYFLVALLMTLFIAFNATFSTANDGVKPQELPTGLSTAIVAGGCFWCIETPFENVVGIYASESGYIGGTIKNPTYAQVSSGRSGHYEAVRIQFDPQVISYSDVLAIFWRQFDPTDGGGSFVDRGQQYAPAIFYLDETQKNIAQQWIDALNQSASFDKTLATKLLPPDTFYLAEEYHQDYYRKNPERYKYYRYNSGRDQYLDKIWGKNRDRALPEIKVLDKQLHSSVKKEGFMADNFVKPDVNELKETLTDLQFKVTQKDGTERAFDNAYWDNKQAGIYVDVVSGEPLFSSLDKYDSGTGWPSFTQPIRDAQLVEKEDRTLWATRVEVRSKYADSHLGHVFPDGPAPTGLRYCMNSASMRFIAVEQLADEGYEAYLDLFAEQ